jgi:hypothetical protein
VLSGHEHLYERLNIGSLPYFVNGLGGKSLYNFDTIIQPGSQFRYNADYGAQLVTSYTDSINFKFYNKNGTLIDSYTIPYTPIGIVKTSDEIPESFALSQNYPNPFNPATNIKFDIPKTAMVKLIVYDSTGKEITTILNEEFKAGSYRVYWDAGNLSSGTYFYKLMANNFSETKKMVLVK